MRIGIITGIFFIVLGVGMMLFYELNLRKEIEANELLVEAKLIFEREDRESINNAINIFTKIAAKYPDTESGVESYYYIARGYDRLGFERQAYLKYVYLLKNKIPEDDRLVNDIQTRIARLKIKGAQTEEGVNQLINILNSTEDRGLRSRIYAELGHAYLREGEYDKSSRMFKLAIREDGKNQEALLGRARALKRMGKDEEAYDLYEYFIKYFGNASQYSDDVRSSYLEQLYISAKNAYRSSDYWKAISYFNRLLSYFPGVSKTEDALFMIGECFFSMERYERALDYYNRTLAGSFSHRNEEARIKRGYIFFITGKYNLAAREFDIYLNDYPTGEHREAAYRWKDMSLREVRYRSETRHRQDYEGSMREEEKEDINSEGKEYSGQDIITDQEEVSYGSPEKIFYENIAEL